MTEYWPDGYIKDQILAICPECGAVKEGTVCWHIKHEKECDFVPAGTWFKKRLASELEKARANWEMEHG